MKISDLGSPELPLQLSLKTRRAFRTNLAAFECRQGTTVNLAQIDTENKKVLLDFGNRMIAWFYESVLNDFETSTQ